MMGGTVITAVGLWTGEMCFTTGCKASAVCRAVPLGGGRYCIVHIYYSNQGEVCHWQAAFPKQAVLYTRGSPTGAWQDVRYCWQPVSGTIALSEDKRPAPTLFHMLWRCQLSAAASWRCLLQDTRLPHSLLVLASLQTSHLLCSLKAVS